VWGECSRTCQSSTVFAVEGLTLGYRVALERVVHGPIEDGIGNGVIAEIVMPLIERELACSQRRGAVVTIVEDFQQVTHGLIGERREPEVVDAE
jgi:hypothetical protein